MPTLDDFEFTEAQILRVQPGDVVVFRVRDLDPAAAQDAMERIHAMLGVPVIVMDALSIDVMRATPARWEQTDLKPYLDAIDQFVSDLAKITESNVHLPGEPS